MSQRPFHRLMIGTLIVLLHLPLLYHTQSLYRSLAPGQDIADLAPGAVLLLLALAALPYVVLGLSGIKWNPERARLNEYDS